MAPYYTYVPDALFKIEDKYIRLEVQLSRVTDNYFATMLEVARDKHPVLLVCLPEQLDYFENKCHSIPRIRVVALGHKIKLHKEVARFGIEKNPNG